MNVIATNDMDEIYEDPEYGEMGELEKLSTKVDESEDTDDTAASVEAAVKQKEEIVAMEAAAVNGGDRDGVNTFAAAIVVEVEAVNAKCVGVEAVKGDIMVKGSKVKATAKGRVLTKEEHVKGYETRDVLGVKMPRRSEKLKKISQGLDVKALNFKTRKQRFKVQELQGSVKVTHLSAGCSTIPFPAHSAPSHPSLPPLFFPLLPFPPLLSPSSPVPGPVRWQHVRVRVGGRRYRNAVELPAYNLTLVTIASGKLTRLVNSVRKMPSAGAPLTCPMRLLL
ncbi:unnamed protein product [Closterium sp. Naga37s-1]|nr:unnamed protein product [Closterium sp. Naga37s-1]